MRPAFVFHKILKSMKIRAIVKFFFLPSLRNAAIMKYNAACGAVIEPAVRKYTQSPAVCRALFVIRKEN